LALISILFIPVLLICAGSLLDYKNDRNSGRNNGSSNGGMDSEEFALGNYLSALGAM
jgi:hypothetical protein